MRDQAPMHSALEGKAPWPLSEAREHARRRRTAARAIVRRIMTFIRRPRPGNEKSGQAVEGASGEARLATRRTGEERKWS